jgi:membrane protease YdiL (CAAX protease family)
MEDGLAAGLEGNEAGALAVPSPGLGTARPKLRAEIRAIRKAQIGLLFFYLAAGGVILLPAVPYTLWVLLLVIVLYRVVKKSAGALLRGPSAVSASYALFLQVLLWMMTIAFGMFLLSALVSWVGERGLVRLWMEASRRMPRQSVLLKFSLGTALNVAVLVPIYEELFFRGYLLQAYRRVGDGFAIVASALLFAAGHMVFFNVLYTFFCGLFWGILVVRYNSVLPSILCHMINNFAAIFLTALGGDRSASPDPTAEELRQAISGFADLQPQGMLYAAAVFLGLSYLFYRVCRRLRRQSGEEAPFLMTIYEAARIFFHWPVVLVALVVVLELFGWGSGWGEFFRRFSW